MPINTTKLRTIREQRGLSQAAAARAAGLTRQRWCDLECGRRPRPSLDLTLRVARALGVQVEELM